MVTPSPRQGKKAPRRTTVHLYLPGELAPDEKRGLLDALEKFANLGGGRCEYLEFGKQYRTFFPVPICDYSQVSATPLAPPYFESTITTAEGQRKEWRKAVAWETECYGLALFYRGCLRNAWHPPYPGPFDVVTGEEFATLLGLDTGQKYADREDAVNAVLAAYPSAKVESNPIVADWKTGSFIYQPINDFQRAAYILFREGWRAKVCARCSRRFIADKPMQRYCSTKCFGDAKRERNLNWWNKDGKRLRMETRAPASPKGRKIQRRRGTRS